MTNKDAINMNDFVIEYEYFGLSNSAQVKKSGGIAEPYYECVLHSSEQKIYIRQEIESGFSYWIDISVGSTTPLSQILGVAIENKFASRQH